MDASEGPAWWGLVDFPLSMPFKAKSDIGADFQERIASSVASSERGMPPHWPAADSSIIVRLPSHFFATYSYEKASSNLGKSLLGSNNNQQLSVTGLYWIRTKQIGNGFQEVQTSAYRRRTAGTV